MPEGPEVKRMCDMLNAKYAGRLLQRIDLTPFSRYVKDGGIPNTGPLHQLFPMTIESIRSKGKRLIFALIKGNVRVSMISFLCMEGRWLYHPDKHTALVLTIENKGYLYYSDGRKLGWLKFAYSQPEYDVIFKEVGPDYLLGEVTPELYYQVIRKTNPGMKIGKFIKEQKYFSGVGNYLRAEILYRSRISPHRLLGYLSDQEVMILYQISMNIIRESEANGGLTIATYADPEGNPGTFVPIVYQQTFDPNGYQIITDKTIDSQVMHWCPQVQV
jgi:formamidopyrimidine-DNA glycosylase